jgi:hypothetical protein
VVVCGTSREELNGKRGTATAFDDDSGRYTVELDDDTNSSLRFKVANVRPEPSLEGGGGSDRDFASQCPLLGHTVRVVGTSKPEVNGSPGVVTGFDQNTGRYVVELANNVNNGRGLKLKPSNVERPLPAKEEEDDDDDDAPPPLEGDDDAPPPPSPTTPSSPSQQASASGSGIELPSEDGDWSAIAQADLPYDGDVMEAQRQKDRLAVKNIFAWRRWWERNGGVRKAPKRAAAPKAVPAAKASPKTQEPDGVIESDSDDGEPPAWGGDEDGDGGDMPPLDGDDDMPPLDGDDDMPPLDGEEEDVGNDDWVGESSGGAAAPGKKKKKNKKKKKKGKKAAAADDDSDDSDNEGGSAAAEAAAKAAVEAAAAENAAVAEAARKAAADAEKQAAAAQAKAEEEARQERARYEKRKQEEEAAALAAVAKEAEVSAKAAEKMGEKELAKAKKAKEAERQRRNYERKQAEQAAKVEKEKQDEIRKAEKEAKHAAKKEARRLRKLSEAEKANAEKEAKEDAASMAAAVKASKQQAMAEAEFEGFTVVGGGNKKAQQQQQRQQQQQQQSASRQEPTPPSPQSGFEAVTTAPGAADLLWECEVCTYHNKGIALACGLCNGPRPIEVTAVPPAFNPMERPFVPSPSDVAGASYDGSQDAFDASAYANPFLAPTTQGTRSPPRRQQQQAPTPPVPVPVEEDAALAAALLASGSNASLELWACKVCTYGNHPDRGICEICHTAKGGAKAVPSALQATAAATAAAATTTTTVAPPPVAAKNKNGNKQNKKAAAAAAAATAAAATAEVAAPSAKDGDEVVDGEWTVSELAERRVDPNDGNFYTKEEFFDFYKPGNKEWHAAKYASLCDFFARGKCKDGESCKFRHVKPNGNGGAAATPGAAATSPSLSMQDMGGAASWSANTPSAPAPFARGAAAGVPPPGIASGWGSGGSADSAAGGLPPGVPQTSASSPFGTGLGSGWDDSSWTQPTAAPTPTPAAAAAAVEAAPGRGAGLLQVLGYLKCSAETTQKLQKEEYDTAALLHSEFDDFKELGVRAQDCNALASWVATVNLYE